MARLGAARVLHLTRPGAYARCACGCFAAKFSYSVAEFSLFSRSVARRVRATRMLPGYLRLCCFPPIGGKRRKGPRSPITRMLQAHVLLIVKQMIR